MRDEITEIFDNPDDPEYTIGELLSEKSIDQLKSLIREKQKEARIDELKLRKAHDQPEQDWIDKRIKQLKEEK